MTQVVQANCPHCKHSLRIPADWLSQPMRCKHCRQLFQARTGPVSYPVGQPYAPPPTRPVPVSSPTPAPLTKSAGGATSAPFTFDERPAIVSPRQTYRAPRTWWKGLLVAVCLAGLAALVVAVWGPEISKLFNPGRPEKPAQDVAALAKKADPPVPAKKDSPAPKEPTTDEGVAKKGPDPGETKKKEIPPEVKGLPKKEPTPNTDGSKPKVDQPPKKKDPPSKIVSKDRERFPRRALLVSVNDYLLANPLEYGQSALAKGFAGSSTGALKTNLGRLPLDFPNTQLTELSDAAFVPHSPLKPVIERTLVDFLAGSRAQDRVVVVFAGHAAEDDKEAYLVPLEGDLSDPKTLIPLSWVYDRLKECKARQKVLILDVCRLDPARGNERPGGEPMGKVLDARLQQPPAGVQVWACCTLGQNSYEFEKGSLFLEALCAVAQKAPGVQDVGSPVPVEAMVARVNEYMDSRLARYNLKGKQVSRLAGQEPAGGAPPNPEEKLPDALVILPPPVEGGALAAKRDVDAILSELNQVPPVRVSRSGVKDSAIKATALPAFSAKALAAYRPDYEPGQDFIGQADKYPLRAAVQNAAKVMREYANKYVMQETFSGASTAQVKNQIKAKQAVPGKVELYLKEALQDLTKAGEKRGQEKSKRWQANYDFVLARLLSRLIYVKEYNYVLAQIRTDSLPELENGMTGYRLGSRTDKKVSVTEPEVREWTKEARRAWDRLVNDHAGTPWAVMAQRERMTVLGLEWRPTKQ